MREMKLWMMAVMMAGAMTTMAQKPAIDEVYLTVDEVPNAVYWLPVPPEPGSTQFVHDINQYYWGRRSDRTRRAPRRLSTRPTTRSRTWYDSSVLPLAWRYLQKRRLPSTRW